MSLRIKFMLLGMRFKQFVRFISGSLQLNLAFVKWASLLGFDMMNGKKILIKFVVSIKPFDIERFSRANDDNLCKNKPKFKWTWTYLTSNDGKPNNALTKKSRKNQSSIQAVTTNSFYFTLIVCSVFNFLEAISIQIYKHRQHGTIFSSVFEVYT